MHISFVTYNEKPALTPDDELLAAYFRTKGISVSPAAWNDDAVDWKQYDVIVLRSTWDYHKKIDHFNSWLDKLHQLGCYVLNPVAIIKLNQNKKYLTHLLGQGKHIPPFVFYRQNSAASLDQILVTNQWEKAVVKPAVSGGSFNTWITSGSTAKSAQAEFERMLAAGDVIVQKFMNEIVEQGELSLMFFNKIFSHAVLKRATQGDFRVQSQFGGTVKSVVPDEDIIQYATSLLADIDEPLLYARVDGVVSGGQFYLMELELIEPALFMVYHPDSCENFFRAFEALISTANKQIRDQNS
jgi:glutathione synthase/RimK-type ligase-like ATP-grasp enzyme